MPAYRVQRISGLMLGLDEARKATCFVIHSISLVAISISLRYLYKTICVKSREICINKIVILCAGLIVNLVCANRMGKQLEFIDA